MPGEVELRVYFLSSISNIPVTLVWGLVAMLFIGFVVLVWIKGWREGLRASSVLMLVEWVFLIICTAVIFREIEEYRCINMIPLSSYFDIAENSYLMEKAAINVLNVVLFIPVGFLLGFCLNDRRRTKDEKRWLWVIAVGAGISFAIELLQLVFKKGLCEVDDLIHNVVGCMIGYTIYKLLIKRKYV